MQKIYPLLITSLLLYLTGCTAEALSGLVSALPKDGEKVNIDINISKDTQEKGKQEKTKPQQNTDDKEIDSIKMVGVPLHLVIGQKVSIGAKIQFKNGNSSEDVIWQVSNEEIARIENNQWLVPLQEGTIELEVKTRKESHFSEKATLKVVKDLPVAPPSSVENLPFSPSASTPTTVSTTAPQPSSSPATNTNSLSGLTCDIQLLSTKFAMDGDPNPAPVYYTGTVTNHSNKDIERVALQAYIEQGGKRIAAGGAIVPLGIPAETNGLVKAGHQIKLANPNNTSSSDGYHYSANAGFAREQKLSPGPAVLIIQLIDQSTGKSEVVEEKRFEVTLVG